MHPTCKAFTCYLPIFCAQVAEVEHLRATLAGAEQGALEAQLRAEAVSEECERLKAELEAAQQEAAEAREEALSVAAAKAAAALTAVADAAVGSSPTRSASSHEGSKSREELLELQGRISELEEQVRAE